MQVRTPAFACKVSIVRWSGERDGFGGTGEHVRDRVGESLEQVRLESDLIVDDIVVGGTDCPLKTVVGLKEEIEICVGCPLISRQSKSPRRHTHRRRRLRPCPQPFLVSGSHFDLRIVNRWGRSVYGVVSRR